MLSWGWSLLQPCHLDRLRGSEASEREWRDPENASSATLIRGVLPNLREVCCAQPTTPKPNSRVVVRRTSLQALDLHSQVGVGKRASGMIIRVELPGSATRRADPRGLS